MKFFDEGVLDEMLERLEPQHYITVELTKSEFNYLSNLCHFMYDNLNKFPKSMRPIKPSKFYILEVLIYNVFKK